MKDLMLEIEQAENCYHEVEKARQFSTGFEFFSRKTRNGLSIAF